MAFLQMYEKIPFDCGMGGRFQLLIQQTVDCLSNTILQRSCLPNLVDACMAKTREGLTAQQ